MTQHAQHWGELRSIVHGEKVDIFALLTLLERWPIEAQKDEALCHYLESQGIEHDFVSRRPTPPADMVERLLVHYRYLLKQRGLRPPPNDMYKLDTLARITFHLYEPAQAIDVFRWLGTHASPYFGANGDAWGGIEAGYDVEFDELIEVIEDIVEDFEEPMDVHNKLTFYNVFAWEGGPALDYRNVFVERVASEPYLRVVLYNTSPGGSPAYDRSDYWRVSLWPAETLVTIFEIAYQVACAAPNHDVRWLERSISPHLRTPYPTAKYSGTWPTEKPMFEALWQFYVWARTAPETSIHPA